MSTLVVPNGAPSVVRTRGFTAVRLGLGVLLLIVAGLKLYGLHVDPVARVGTFSAPWFQTLLIQFEVLLGLWLLSGRSEAAAWLCATVTFLLFASFSFYSGYIGQASCGCFGAIEASPWWAFGVDVAILAALATFRPLLNGTGPSPGLQWRSQLKQAACGLAPFALFLGLTSALAYVCFGSLPAAVAYLRGERITVFPGLLNVGEGAPGEWKESRVEVANWNDHAIRVVGGTSDCSCVATPDLPATVEPGQRKAVTVRVHLPRSPGILTRRAMFLVDDRGLRHVEFTLTGRCIESP